MEGETDIQFVKATKESVFSFLNEARVEVVIAKAGYFLDKSMRCLIQQKKVYDVIFMQIALKMQLDMDLENKKHLKK